MGKISLVIHRSSESNKIYLGGKKMSKEDETIENTEALEAETAEVAEEVKAETVEESKEESAVEESTVDAPAEEAKEEKAPVEEPVVEESNEALEEEPVAEEVKEEPAEADKSEDEVPEEIKETKEELSVIKEVRDELIVMYKNNKALEMSVEKLTKENTEAKSKVEKLSLQLKEYVLAEEKLEADRKFRRLEKLSAKFKVLGQEKSVEQLSKMDNNTLKEFEEIVDMATEKLSDETEVPSETASSQAEPEVSVEAPKVEASVREAEPKKMPEKLSNDAFFANICKTLTSSQDGTYSNGKKVLDL